MTTGEIKYNNEVYHYGEIIPLGLDSFFKSFFLNNRNAIGYKADLLSKITGLPKEDFEEKADFSSEELTNSNGFLKSQSVDILIKMNKTILNLEMNKIYYLGLMEKNVSYVAKLFSTALIKGENYKGEIKAIQISFDMFDMFKNQSKDEKTLKNKKRKINETRLKRTFALMDIDTHELYSSQMIIIHINLDYVRKKIYNGGVLTELERLLIPFVVTKEEQMNKFGIDEEAKEAIEFMEELSNKNTLFTEAERELMEIKEKESMLETAKSEGIAVGRKSGLAEGHKSGLAEGHKAGVAEGLAKGEDKKNKEIALKMLNKDMDIKTIQEITGLTEKEILELKS